MAELTRTLESVHLATRKLASLGDMDVVLRDVLSICIEAVGAESGTIYLHDPATKTLMFKTVLPTEIAEVVEARDIPDSWGIAGRVFHSAKAEITELTEPATGIRAEIEERSGIVIESMITVPLSIDGATPIGLVQLINKKDGKFNENDLVVLDTVSNVSTLAILNSRLLDRSTRVASLEGMGQVAHDLANKSSMLIAYLPHFRSNLKSLRSSLEGSVITDEARFYLDMIEGAFEDVFAPYSERIYRYSRLINDLSAGKKLTPQLKLMHLGKVVEESVQYLESKARELHIQIEYDLDRKAPMGLFDDLFISRIAENLVQNALKAMSDSMPENWLERHWGMEEEIFGNIIVRTRFEDGHHSLEVIDNGPGMNVETIKRILTGEARSGWMRNSGTGLGTKVVKELASSLGGELKIESEPGHGTTMRIIFPHVTSVNSASG